MKKKTVYLLIILLTTGTLFGAAWELARNEDGIKVYTREEKGQSLRSFRATATVNASMAVIVEVLKDTDNYHQWYGDCKLQRKIKEYSPLESLVYHVQKVPVISNRDLVVRGKITVNYQKGTAMQTMCAVKSPYGKDSGNVRMPFMKGSFTMKQLSPGSTLVTYTMQADPGGSVPRWLANSTAKKQPFKTLKGLQKIVKNPKYAALAQKAVK